MATTTFANADVQFGDAEGYVSTVTYTLSSTYRDEDEAFDGQKDLSEWVNSNQTVGYVEPHTNDLPSTPFELDLTAGGYEYTVMPHTNPFEGHVDGDITVTFPGKSAREQQLETEVEALRRQLRDIALVPEIAEDCESRELVL